jgi:oxalate decarboxylase/phosphoglucose isomerase-like protein (cupin superfamily)
VKRFSAPAGIDVGLVRGRPAVGAGITLFERAARPLGALREVLADPAPISPRRAQYWMLNGMVRDGDAARTDPRLCYDFTFLPDRPVGWERAKTLGHSHARPPGARLGFAEIIEVVEGTAGFIVSDILPGPRATFAALIVAGPGERVAMPPFLSHASINLSGDPVVFTDVIDRRVVDGRLPSDYSRVKAAHGLPWYIDRDGHARPNAAYKSAPELQRFTALEWSGPWPDRPLYLDYVERPGSLEWLASPDLFPDLFADLWARVRDVALAAE